MITEKQISKIKPLNNILENEFELKIGSSSVGHLMDIIDIYEHKRQNLLKHLGETARDNPEYKKAFLLKEAATMLLREIAPKRRKKKKRGKK